jgi:hypothetical protein
MRTVEAGALGAWRHVDQDQCRRIDELLTDADQPMTQSIRISGTSFAEANTIFLPSCRGWH